MTISAAGLAAPLWLLQPGSVGRERAFAVRGHVRERVAAPLQNRQWQFTLRQDGAESLIDRVAVR